MIDKDNNIQLEYALEDIYPKGASERKREGELT